MAAFPDWQIFSIGMVREEWKGLPDGLVVDWSDACGLTLFIYFNQVTRAEKDAISVGNRFEIAFKDEQGIGFFAVKFGDLPWSDCVFSPNLYAEIPQFKEPEDGKTYALNVMLVDTAAGELKSMRVIALGREFCDQFRRWCLDSLDKNISRRYYDRVADEVYKQYPLPEQLAAAADFRWVLPKGTDEPKREERELE